MEKCSANGQTPAQGIKCQGAPPAAVPIRTDKQGVVGGRVPGLAVNDFLRHQRADDGRSPNDDGETADQHANASSRFHQNGVADAPGQRKALLPFGRYGGVQHFAKAADDQGLNIPARLASVIIASAGPTNTSVRVTKVGEGKSFSFPDIDFFFSVYFRDGNHQPGG